eukprot:m.228753 g.228753  ORF g.228753 m.228753 type:complete len:86 (+) comp19250_c1_seq48:3523-3780(+)
MIEHPISDQKPRLSVCENTTTITHAQNMVPCVHIVCNPHYFTPAQQVHHAGDTTRSYPTNALESSVSALRQRNTPANVPTPSASK